jgi:hypothetical protein
MHERFGKFATGRHAADSFLRCAVRRKSSSIRNTAAPALIREAGKVVDTQDWTRAVDIAAH